MSIYERDELNKPINETLFGPMRKKLSPLPDSPEKSKGQPEKKGEEKTKEEGRVEEKHKQQPEEEPLPDSPEKSEGQPEKKREEETKDEGRVEKHKKKQQPEETTSKASQTEESTWKMVKIDAPTNDIDEGPPSLMLRLGAMLDEFFRSHCSSTWSPSPEVMRCLQEGEKAADYCHLYTGPEAPPYPNTGSRHQGPEAMNKCLYIYIYVFTVYS